MPEKKTEQEAQPLTPEQRREQIRLGVIEKMRKKHTSDDNKFDIDGMLEDYWRRDSKLHTTSKEAKERRLCEEEYIKKLEKSADILKEREEKDLKEQKKFEELLELKNKEITDAKQKLADLDRLKNFEIKIKDDQEKAVEAKISTLSKEQRELFDTAFDSVDEAYSKKLALIEKLTKGSGQQQQQQAGGEIENPLADDDPQKLYELKQTNPDRYKAVIREKTLGKKT